ncbi:hypothetical protein CEK71_13580 [Methylovulum psychrotolerans]|uniref:Uncharacterized protein n=2 Tax=Methylovulum psychrotolerans TaxID=1704499 RepID=A0A1Z4C0J6_9GAMM|nr:hypothetical protein CEK71_13580 [Methylovulum psychrotolerans]
MLDMTQAEIIGTPYRWWPADVLLVPLEVEPTGKHDFQIDESAISCGDHEKIRNALIVASGGGILKHPEWHRPLGVNRIWLPSGAEIRKIQ